VASQGHLRKQPLPQQQGQQSQIIKLQPVQISALVKEKRTSGGGLNNSSRRWGMSFHLQQQLLLLTWQQRCQGEQFKPTAV
jgi:hypothetical protein